MPDPQPLDYGTEPCPKHRWWRWAVGILVGLLAIRMCLRIIDNVYSPARVPPAPTTATTTTTSPG
jgi:hypothetical protein